MAPRSRAERDALLQRLLEGKLPPGRERNKAIRELYKLLKRIAGALESRGLPKFDADDLWQRLVVELLSEPAECVTEPGGYVSKRVKWRVLDWFRRQNREQRTTVSLKEEITDGDDHGGPKGVVLADEQPSPEYLSEFWRVEKIRQEALESTGASRQLPWRVRKLMNSFLSHMLYDLYDAVTSRPEVDVEEMAHEVAGLWNRIVEATDAMLGESRKPQSLRRDLELLWLVVLGETTISAEVERLVEKGHDPKKSRAMIDQRLSRVRKKLLARLAEQGVSEETLDQVGRCLRVKE